MKLPIIDKVDPHMQEVVRGGSVACVLKGLAAGVAFAFNILLSRLLGAEGAGIYFLALTVAAIAIVFGSLGLDNVVLRFTAAGAAVENWAMVKGVYQKGMILSLLASAVAAVGMAISAPWLAEQVFSKSELTSPIRWMSLGVVPMTQLILHAHLLNGLKRIRDSQLIEGVSVHTLSLLGLFFLGQVWGVRGAVWAYTFSALLTALLGYWIWHKATPQLRDTTGRFNAKDLLRSSLPLFVVASLSLAMNWTSTFMLGIWCSNADVGIFAMASRTAMVTSFVLIAVNTIAAPKFAALYQQGNIEELDSIARSCMKLMTFLSAPAFLLFVLAPEWVMTLFGPQFASGKTVLVTLSFAQFFNVAAGSVGPLLMMTGNERSLQSSVTATAVSCVILNSALVPAHGIIGAAIANSISVVLVNVFCLWAVHKHLGISLASSTCFTRR